MDPPKEGFPISAAMTGRVVTLLPGEGLPTNAPAISRFRGSRQYAADIHQSMKSRT